ncbi:MAG: SUMF1/EgtB/PvdO family nonheme iron enzyme [Nitrospira sp.]|nr:SUMF1/EgtB/PvdO family nonheme iron enzyme [Nitrospira sp.]
MRELGVQEMIGDPVGEARARMDAVFDLVPEEQWYARPVPERHRLIFYLGHMEAFDWNLLTAGEPPSFHTTLDQLFAFGIDPKPSQLPNDQPEDWPSLTEVRRYVRHVRDQLDERRPDTSPMLLAVASEHRLMHAETFAYLLHNLDQPVRRSVSTAQPFAKSSPPPRHRMVTIPAGKATLGVYRRKDPVPIPSNGFHWDNEFEAEEVAVPAFEISRYKVTNVQYRRFVEDGASPPRYWRRRHGAWWWRTLTGHIPLPMDWPVFVSYNEAVAYAHWSGQSLPTEAQYHRAAYGTLGDDERHYPWGKQPPDPAHGNFNFQRWDPVPVTACPMGDSAFGVAQMLGNGWEWTSTVFAPLRRFMPFEFYPGYSAPFFDGQHHVVKGGSPLTAARLLRRSFRNWYRPNYSYVYAGFRCVSS